MKKREQIKKGLSILISMVLLVSIFTGFSTTSRIKASAGTTLTVYALTAPEKPLADQIVADYKAQTGVTINWEIPGSDVYTVLKTRLASNQMPDVFELGTGDYSKWASNCDDLSRLDFIKQVERPAVIPATINGIVYGMPFAMTGNGIVYNKDLFKKAGIKNVPLTLNELEADCKKLKAAGIQSFGEDYKDWGFLMHIFGTTFAYENNPKATGIAMAKGLKKISNLRYIDNFFRLFDMTLKYGLGKDSIGYDFNAQVSDFAKGKMAMVKQGTWYGAPVLAANPKMNMGLFAVPLTNDASQTKLMTSSASFFSIYKSSKNKVAAEQLLNWLSKNMQKYIVDMAKTYAPYKNVKISGLGSLNQDMESYIKNKKAFSIFGNEEWPNGFNTDIASPLQAYAAGAINKAQCIDQLQTDYSIRAKTK